MEIHLLLIFAVFAQAVLTTTGDHGAMMTPEAYWKMKLPYTPMPQSIKDCLPQLDSTGMSMGRKAKVHLSGLSHTKGSLGTIADYVGYLSYKKDSLPSADKRVSHNKKDSVSTDQYGGLLSYKKGSALTSASGYNGLLSYKKGSALTSTSGYNGLLSYKKGSTLASTSGYDGLLSYKKGSALTSASGYGGLLSYKKGSALTSASGYDGLLSYKKGSAITSTSGSYGGLLSYKKGSDLTSTKSPYTGIKKGSDSHVDETSKHPFFVEKDLHVGAKMNLEFNKGSKKAMFLPRSVAESIPFSSDKLPKILGMLDIKPGSSEAKVVADRISLCEEEEIEGVEKKCLTSLEAMVDYVVYKIGKNVKAVTTEVEKDTNMQYRIEAVDKMADYKMMVCHKMGYPYALYFCHRTKTIRSYMTSLVGVDGTKIKAVVACHKETNDFLENYELNVLHISPGSTHVCHFLAPEDNIVWVAP